MPSTFHKAVATGLLTAVLGSALSVLPLGYELEAETGLDWLFKVRGAREAPRDVVVVSIDEDSVETLGLPRKPEKWSRSVHAQLVDTLSAAGARAVGFDIVFSESRTEEGDARFAKAIADAGNVVLLQFIDKDVRRLRIDSGKTDETVLIERLVSPIPVLTDAAAGVAPFPLPKVPAKVKQAWLFKNGTGEAPTLPTVMLQLYALQFYEQFVGLINEVDPVFAAALPPTEQEVPAGGIEALVRKIRARFLADPQIGDRVSSALKRRQSEGKGDGYRLLEALITLYRGRDDVYVNFYGPARSIETIPYHAVVRSRDNRPGAVDVQGKAVFVGISESSRPDQRDGFYTSFTSKSTGLDISGVEIAATTFANLVERMPVTPLVGGELLTVIFAWGILLGVVSRLFAAPIALAGAVMLAIAYAVFAYLRFAGAGIWYPLAIPLLLQLPVAVFVSVLWRYLDANKERQRIRRALGYYLPPNVVDELAKDLSRITGANRVMHGICLHTDVEKFTSLSERISPGELGALMNDYFEEIIQPVRRYGGIVSNLAGDSMLATWATVSPDPQLPRAACLAALEICEAVERFNRSVGDTKLPTRIGLHAGDLLVGNIGAVDHYEYSALGDIVNTAARIQALNKRLGTRILVSADVLRGLDAVVTRELGEFLLVGKTRPVTIHELLALGAETDDENSVLRSNFKKALQAFRMRDWQAASVLFSRLVDRYPADLASQLYLSMCEQYRHRPPAPNWNGVIEIDTK